MPRLPEGDVLLSPSAGFHPRDEVDGGSSAIKEACPLLKKQSLGPMILSSCFQFSLFRQGCGEGG